MLDARALALAKRPELMKVAELMYKANMRRYVTDPVLRAKLTPHYRPGCKRILLSDNFYQAVANPKTEMITDSITRVTPHGIVTADGTEREVDAIVFATGFHVTDSSPTSTSRAPTAKISWTVGTGRAWSRTAGSPSPMCRTCSSCWGRTPGSATTRSCS